MKPEAQRLALAKLDGWTCISSTYLTGLPPYRNVDQYSAKDILSNNVPIEELPDYLGDLNAVHRLAVKCVDQLDNYTYELRKIIQRDCNRPEFYVPGAERSQLIADFWFYQATAEQRGEAILRATNLWTDDER